MLSEWDRPPSPAASQRGDAILETPDVMRSRHSRVPDPFSRDADSDSDVDLLVLNWSPAQLSTSRSLMDLRDSPEPGGRDHPCRAEGADSPRVSMTQYPVRAYCDRLADVLKPSSASTPTSAGHRAFDTDELVQSGGTAPPDHRLGCRPCRRTQAVPRRPVAQHHRYAPVLVRVARSISI